MISSQREALELVSDGLNALYEIATWEPPPQAGAPLRPSQDWLQTICELERALRFLAANPDGVSRFAGASQTSLDLVIDVHGGLAARREYRELAISATEAFEQICGVKLSGLSVPDERPPH